MNSEDLLSCVMDEWLQSEPPEKELSLNGDGSQYMSIDVIKPKLRSVDPNFSTRNFQHYYILLPDGRIAFSGSVELCVSFTILYKNKKKVNIQRVITGSATFNTQKYYEPSHDTDGNFNWGPICLSLCIVNAAKELGPQFGMNLNRIQFPGEEPPKNDKIKNTLNQLSTDIKDKVKK